MIPDWNVPASLLSPYGTLTLNDQNAADGYYVLMKDRCRIGPTVRAEKNDIPQADGSLLHRRWLTGVVLELAIELWQDFQNPACDDQLETMYELLALHARGIQNAGDNEGRFFWTPSGKPTRMLDDIKLLEYPTISFPQGVPEVTFAVETGYPYAIDLTQTSTEIPDSGSETLTNAGNAQFWPVFQVQGTTAYFEITNMTLGLSFIYDSALPGAMSITAPDYAEIDTFRNTIYLNGDEDNLKPGIDVLNSDFFPLGPGDNEIGIVGADMTVLWQSAWG